MSTEPERQNSQPDRSRGIERSPEPSDLAAHLRIMHQERDAALRAMAGRLAHQMRNPLAAIQAACNSLRAELKDPDHQHRLDLTLNEVKRVLTLISVTVQSVSENQETASAFDLVREIHTLIGALRYFDPETPDISVTGEPHLDCVLPRRAFQTALYSLLQYLLAAVPGGIVQIEIRDHETRSELVASISLSSEEAGTSSIPPPREANPGPSISLLVTERFARDVGGRLSQMTSGDDRVTLTLDLPCRHV